MKYLFVLIVLTLEVAFSNVNFPPTINIANQKLVLNGQGIRFVEKFFMKFDVYKAALYLPQKSNEALKIMSDKNIKFLKLTFLRDVDKDSLINGWRESFKKNTSASQFEAVKKDLTKMNEYMSDIKENQSIQISFLSTSTKIKFAQKDPIKIDGSVFLSTLLSVWLGVPPNESLKKELLGQVKR